jgi:CTP synthase
VVPHVTNEIKEHIKDMARQSLADVVIVEVGGTVGDIEGLPFLEAIRQMRNDVGRDSVLYIHLTLLPFLSTTGELKTKPTQHSVNELRRIGIQPDVILCRSEKEVTEGVKDKISLFCDVQKRAVIPLPTVSTIYELPLVLEEYGLGELMVEMLRLPHSHRDLQEWRQIVDKLHAERGLVNIALVGKYVELWDAYISVKEALCHAGIHHERDVNILWIHSEAVEGDGADKLLRNAQGIVVPGGFGQRGIEGMIRAARYARENGIPYLGLCLGMQVMVIEFARHVFGSVEVNSTEFNPGTPYPVIDLMPDQSPVASKGGTMRLGGYPCRLVPGTRAYEAYGTAEVWERHRHRYEFNNRYREELTQAGLVASGVSPEGHLVEICELAAHPWMMGTQFHPEFRSRPNRPHPLFRDFLGVAKDVLREGAQPLLPLS